MAAHKKPALYTIPPGLPFLRVLAEAILGGSLPGGASAPENNDFSHYTILVPTRRAARALQDVFWQACDRKSILLPIIRPLGDVDEDEIVLTQTDINPHEPDLTIPLAISPLERQMLLARYILDWARDQHELLFGEGPSNTLVANPAQAIALAGELGALIDSAETEEIELTAISSLVADQFAENWQLTLDFLKILFETLPAELEGRKLIGPMARRNLLLRAEADRLEQTQPEGPVIAAGSTGSIPATAHLLKTITGLPNGAVVLPGLDMHLDDASWEILSESHPQFGLKQLLQRMDAPRDAVKPLSKEGADTPSQARVKLLSEVMRPAQTTELWTKAFTGIGREALAATVETMTLIEAPSPREEALAIALILRDAAQTPDKTAALVTPDRNLARRVAFELLRWNITIDDSAGRPLTKSPSGTFLLLLAQAVAENFSPISLAALLKHPLTSAGQKRITTLSTARTIELAALRGARPAPGLDGLAQALAQTKENLAQGMRAHPSLSRLDEDAWQQAFDLVARLKHILAPLAALFDMNKECALGDIFKLHFAAAEALSAQEVEGSDQTPGVWQGESGEDLTVICASLLETAETFGTLAPREYPAVLEALLSRAVTRPRMPKYPNLHIWGLLEARLQEADIMILGGLNESSWPSPALADPWVNRPMRAGLGLQPPERQIGLAAHDFVQAANMPQVYLTRSSKAAGAPTIASRWLLRLNAFLSGIGAGQTITSDASWLEWAQALDQTDQAVPASPPRPSPPLAARPRKMSVTEIENWIRDPYAIYARRILGLQPLEPIDAAPSAAERGSLIHDIFHKFTKTSPGTLGPKALAQLLECGREVFAQHISRPGVAAFWWPRFERMAAWFVEQEPSLRQSVSRQLTEVSGSFTFEAPGGPFELTARADRLDVMASGGIKILDYKTGQLPSVKQVSASFSPQLPLEAVIAEKGGFKGLEMVEVETLIYIHLSGGLPAGVLKLASSTKEQTGELGQQALEGLMQRVQAFDDDAMPYLPSIARDFESQPRDYDHLARYREWAANPEADKPS